MFFLLMPLLHAEEIVLRNDTAYDDSFDQSDLVGGLAYPECAISVLTPEAADLPMSIHTVRFLFTSQFGLAEGFQTMATMGIQVLSDGSQVPTAGSFAWGPEAFSVTVSSQALNALEMNNPSEGLYPLEITEGAIAVWVCASDPATGSSWDYTTDVIGVMIESSSPSPKNYLYDGLSVQPLLNFGANGAWVIRAVSGQGGGTNTGTETSTSTSTDTGTETGTETSTETGTTTDTSTDSEEQGELSIDTITPNEAVVGEAVDFTITGFGFDENATISIGGMIASALDVHSDTAISGTSPSALPAGVHAVVVSNPTGETATLEDAFTVLDDAIEGGEEKPSSCHTAGLGMHWGLVLIGVLLGWNRRLF